jgi:gas vesicle protein
VVGAIADGSDGAGKGAAIGAASGLLFGGARSRDNREQQQQWEAQQQQQYQANRNNYNRAFAACMEGRNYTVR